MLPPKLLNDCRYHLRVIHKLYIINYIWDILIKDIDYITSDWLDTHFYESFNLLTFINVTTDQMKDVQRVLELGELSKSFEYSGREMIFNAKKQYLDTEFKFNFTFNTPESCEIKYKDVEEEVVNVIKKGAKYYQTKTVFDKVECTEPSMLKALNNQGDLNELPRT